MFLNIKEARKHHKSFVAVSEKTFIKTHGINAYYKKSVLNECWNYPGMFIFVAEHNGKEVAYVMYSYQGENLFMLDTIYVIPVYRKKGVISKLLKDTIYNLKNRFVIHEIKAHNIINDIASDKSLLKAGFEFVSEDSSLYDGVGGNVYSLRIA